MRFRTIVSAFFLDAATTNPDLRSLAHEAGLRNAKPLDADDRAGLGLGAREVLGGTWEVFQETWAIVDQHSSLVCLQLYSPYVRFVDARLNEQEHGPEAEGATPLAYVKTFGDACLKLEPTVALLDTRAHHGIQQWEAQQGNRDWVLAQAERVAAGDVNALADERVSVLYLSELLMLRWESDPVRNDRDAIELPKGRLIFASRGPARMV
jgi:hypothetical protein